MRDDPPAARSYVVCATPRSGSNLLCESLWLSEVAGRPEEHLLPWTAPGAPAMTPADLARVLGDGSARGVFGLKLMWSQLDAAAAALGAATGAPPGPPLETIAAALPGVRWIHVHRLDTLRQAVSWAKAMLTGTWAVTPEWHSNVAAVRAPAAGAPAGPPRYDAELIAWCHGTIRAHVRAWNAAFHGARIEPIDVTYETLGAAYDATAQRVLAALGLPPADPARFASRAMQRQSDGINEQWVARFTADQSAVSA